MEHQVTDCNSHADVCQSERLEITEGKELLNVTLDERALTGLLQITDGTAVRFS
jgi:hypothetical protein